MPDSSSARFSEAASAGTSERSRRSAVSAKQRALYGQPSHVACRDVDRGGLPLQQEIRLRFQRVIARLRRTPHLAPGRGTECGRFEVGHLDRGDDDPESHAIAAVGADECLVHRACCASTQRRKLAASGQSNQSVVGIQIRDDRTGRQLDLHLCRSVLCERQQFSRC